MTRILRLLLIAAVAWPFLGGTAAAQEVKPEQTRSPQKDKILEMKDAARVKSNIVAPKDGVFMHTATPKAASLKSEANTNSVTVFDAPTGTNQYIPVYGWYYDMNNTTSQMIYPSSELEGAGLYVGDEITKLTFYTDDNGIKFSAGKLTFTIGETTTNVFPSNALMSLPSTTVSGTVVPTSGSKTLSVVFTTPLEYTGKNLFVQVINTTTGTCDPSSTDATKWVGRSDLQSTSGNAWYASYCNKNNVGRQPFLPTVTIEKYVDISQLEARDITIKDETFFSGKEYTWIDSEGTHTSYLNEPATTPEQMIAMVKKIYTDPEIPGNLKRGFASNGTDNGETNQAVYYSGVGTVDLTGNYVDDPNSYEWKDGFGWGITGNINEVKESSYLAWHESSSPYRDYLAFYAPFDTEQYKPEKEGLTLLLVELKDTYVDGSNNAITSGTYDTEYDRLKAYFANTVKSIRVITQAKRTGEGVEAGTLFKIDCEKMNKFFLLAKGQLHLDHNSYYYTQGLASNLFTTYDYLFYDNWDFAPEPGGIFYFTNTYSNYSNWYNGSNPTFAGQYFTECHVTEPFFYHMFEQFSPSMPSDSVGSLDLYQNMTTNMESFPVIHDCLGITYMNHQFMLYGADSKDDDCQDIHDLMFFVPDYRMLKDDYRDPDAYEEQYLNYNQNFKPSMGLFVIKQNPITGEQIDGQDTYKLHLTWDSNLLKFLPGEQGQYTLYRVITNPDGTKTYQAVGQFNPNTFEYYDNVPMQQTGQQVTYVVQGQDVGKFLSLQMSNEESYIIPGLDRAEQIRIALNNDYYFSRYDAAEQKNYYSNSLIANNTIGTNVKPQYIENGSQFKFWRATIDEQTGNVIAPADPFVVAEVSNWNATTGGTLTYKNWNDQADFSSKPYGHGYHANVATSTISIDTKGDQMSSNDEVVFDGLKLYDNFSVSVEANTHPAQYVYYVTLETAVPFELAGNGIPSCATIQSGTYAYFECAWGSTMRAWAWNEAGNLTGTNWPGSGTMTQVGTNNGNKVWLWTADASVQPTSIKFNWDNASSMEQTGDYPFINGGYYKHESDVVGAVESTQARSNTVSVPVYKTEMAMNPISAQDVEDDVTHQFPAATKFDVNARYSSRSEILGYYIYRWADGKTAAVDRSIYEDDGADASPQGQAGNQGEYYTVAMNTDFTGRTENFGSNFAPVTASFEDNYVNKAQAADTYTYAPVVELYAPIQAVNLSDNSDRTDYNTYGGPQQMSAGGKIEVEVIKPAASEYSWTADGKTYRYYDVYLKVNVLDMPEGYEVAKVRAWRKIDAQYLGEQAPTQNTPDYTGRLELDSNGEYMFVNKADCQKNESLGDDNTTSTIKPGTFGAVALEQGDEIPMSFVVRVYFTKSQPAGAPMLKAEGDQRYYIAETVVEDKLTYQIPTGIDGVGVMNNVASVKYYNAAGVESDKPFQGVNIVVTRYSDGSTTTTKILK